MLQQCKLFAIHCATEQNEVQVLVLLIKAGQFMINSMYCDFHIIKDKVINLHLTIHTGPVRRTMAHSPSHHQAINVLTAGAQAFLMDLFTRRTSHNAPRGPSADWWVLTTPNPVGTKDLTCLPKHRRARCSKLLSLIR
jgi:hypothetical protein